jgi:hypothetical protein
MAKTKTLIFPAYVTEAQYRAQLEQRAREEHQSFATILRHIRAETKQRLRDHVCILSEYDMKVLSYTDLSVYWLDRLKPIHEPGKSGLPTQQRG